MLGRQTSILISNKVKEQVQKAITMGKERVKIENMF